MQVSLRLSNFTAEAFERITGSVLTAAEEKTIGLLIGGFHFKTNLTVPQVLQALEAEGFEQADFDSINFDFRA